MQWRSIFMKRYLKITGERNYGVLEDTKFAYWGTDW